MIYKFKLIFVLFFLIFTNCKNDNPKLIIPGIGVNNYKIGGKLIDSTNYSYNIKPFVNIRKKNNLIVFIDIYDNRLYTKENIRVGDIYTSIIQKKGKPLKPQGLDKNNKKRGIKSNSNKLPFSLRYNEILFFINKKDSTINKIRVFKN